MPTITFGSQTVSFGHPSELKTFGWPIAPTQPIANWAPELAQFVIACNAGNFRGAIEMLANAYMYAVLADVPSGARAAMKVWIDNNLRSLPVGLLGPETDWSAIGLKRSPA